MFGDKKLLRFNKFVNLFAIFSKNKSIKRSYALAFILEFTKLQIFHPWFFDFTKKKSLVQSIHTQNHFTFNENHLSLPIISCFSTKKSKMPSVTPLSILNSFDVSSLYKIPCLIDSLMRVYLISMYCLKVILNFWHSYYSYLVR